MILWPMFFGALAGVCVIAALYRMDALKERSGIAVLLGAIAFFWPVFAVQANATALIIVAHAAAFLAFATLAAVGFRQGAILIALGIIAHGLFDVLVLFTNNPGPAWWPAFCGALDVVAGGLLVYMIRTRKIPA
ncbi:hypothetical protein ABMC88_08660 [Sulfitobacter sp. HNIBRBA2951]|uniref:hypothetical protein n=1 Tax=Sulfitobacter aquimarinus TaxID=3158557 RepID=UPI0032DF403D